MAGVCGVCVCNWFSYSLDSCLLPFSGSWGRRDHRAPSVPPSEFRARSALHVLFLGFALVLFYFVAFHTENTQLLPHYHLPPHSTVKCYFRMRKKRWARTKQVCAAKSMADPCPLWVQGVMILPPKSLLSVPPHLSSLIPSGRESYQKLYILALIVDIFSQNYIHSVSNARVGPCKCSMSASHIDQLFFLRWETRRRS